MVICDLCKAKIADTAYGAEPDQCQQCDREICSKCSFDLDGSFYCKDHTPNCKDCGSVLTPKSVNCELCEDNLHRACAYKVKYDSPAEGFVGQKLKMNLIGLTLLEKGWLCKAHYEQFDTYRTDSTVIIEYSIKLFKAIGLPPLKILRHVTPYPETGEPIASLILKNDWSAFIVHPKAGTINITMRGFDFDTTVKISTFNHEAAVDVLRDKLIKLLLHHKRALQNNKREFMDDLDIEGRFQAIMDGRGYQRITGREEAWKAVNGITDMLRILTASKNAKF